MLVGPWQLWSNWSTELGSVSSRRDFKKVEVKTKYSRISSWFTRGQDFANSVSPTGRWKNSPRRTQSVLWLLLLVRYTSPVFFHPFLKWNIDHAKLTGYYHLFNNKNKKRTANGVCSWKKTVMRFKAIRLVHMSLTKGEHMWHEYSRKIQQNFLAVYQLFGQKTYNQWKCSAPFSNIHPFLTFLQILLVFFVFYSHTQMHTEEEYGDLRCTVGPVDAHIMMIAFYRVTWLLLFKLFHGKI